MLNPRMGMQFPKENTFHDHARQWPAADACLAPQIASKTLKIQIHTTVHNKMSQIANASRMFFFLRTTARQWLELKHNSNHNGFNNHNSNHNGSNKEITLIGSYVLTLDR